MNQDILDVISEIENFDDKLNNIDMLSHEIEGILIQKGKVSDLCDIIITCLELKNLKSSKSKEIKDADIKKNSEDIKHNINHKEKIRLNPFELIIYMVWKIRIKRLLEFESLGTVTSKK